MGGSRGRQQGNALQRQLTLAVQLMRHERGLTLPQLQQAMTLPKATFHRYLKALKEAGVEIDRACVNGQTRYSVPAHARQAFAISHEQLEALRVVRRKVSALEGTHVTQALDALIRAGARKGAPTRNGWIRASKGRAVAPDHLSQLDRAFSNARRVQIRYRGERDTTARTRTIDPILLRHVGEHVYLHAYDVDAQGTRTFKLNRISRVEVTRTRADHHALDEQAFARTVKAWVGEPVTITVRLSPRAARIADEYPIVEDQALIDEPDGSVRVTATVNGIPEAMRWVLSWGKDAEALEPKALRDAVTAEIHAAASQYVGAGFKPAQPKATRDRNLVGAGLVPARSVAAKKTRPRRSASLTDRETAAD